MPDSAAGHPGEPEKSHRPLLRTQLGGVLRRTRQEQDRTLADVAKSARVSMPYLSELERGRKEASSEVLAAICDALHIELSDVLVAIGRDLIADRARRASLARMEAIRSQRISTSTRGSGDVYCMAA